MRAFELVGDIDDQHRLQARVPEELPTGPVRLIVLFPDEDEAGAAWARGIADEWTEELRDTREDIYTLDDGRPVNAPRCPYLAQFPFGDAPGMKLRPVLLLTDRIGQ